MGVVKDHGAGGVNSGAVDRSGPDLKKIPLEQVEGDFWIVAVLDDLVEYADYRELAEISELLRATRCKVARTLLN